MTCYGITFHQIKQDWQKTLFTNRWTLRALASLKVADGASLCVPLLNACDTQSHCETRFRVAIQPFWLNQLVVRSTYDSFQCSGQGHLTYNRIIRTDEILLIARCIANIMQ